MYCKKCGRELKKESKFCNQCGNKVVVDDKKKLEEKEIGGKGNEREKFYCRNCGKSIDKNSNVCPECGYHLSKGNQNNDSVENFFIYLVSLFIPLVGIIIWMVTKEESPNRARTALILSLISTGLIFIFVILFLLIMFMFIFSGIGGI